METRPFWSVTRPHEWEEISNASAVVRFFLVPTAASPRSRGIPLSPTDDTRCGLAGSAPFGRTIDPNLQGTFVFNDTGIKSCGGSVIDGRIIFGYNSMSCASSSLKSLIDDSLSEDIPLPVPPFSWSLNASSVAYFLT